MAAPLRSRGRRRLVWIIVDSRAAKKPVRSRAGWTSSASWQRLSMNAASRVFALYAARHARVQPAKSPSSYFMRHSVCCASPRLPSSSVARVTLPSACVSVSKCSGCCAAKMSMSLPSAAKACNPLFLKMRQCSSPMPQCVCESTGYTRRELRKRLSCELQSSFLVRVRRAQVTATVKRTATIGTLMLARKCFSPAPPHSLLMYAAALSKTTKRPTVRPSEGRYMTRSATTRPTGKNAWLAGA
mmetsp:Transcript_23600/g.74130  ORF Transcript_23600/g.74130 Transcript_23600/m.74130 type:complete len:243 (-) Transcript_23600:1682-2410(-)